MASGKKLNTKEFTEQFQYNVKKDEIKKQKCENNGVKLLCYSNFNKNILL